MELFNVQCSGDVQYSQKAASCLSILDYIKPTPDNSSRTKMSSGSYSYSLREMTGSFDCFDSRKLVRSTEIYSFA